MALLGSRTPCPLLHIFPLQVWDIIPSLGTCSSGFPSEALKVLGLEPLANLVPPPLPSSGSWPHSLWSDTSGSLFSNHCDFGATAGAKGYGVYSRPMGVMGVEGQTHQDVLLTLNLRETSRSFPTGGLVAVSPSPAEYRAISLTYAGPGKKVLNTRIQFCFKEQKSERIGGTVSGQQDLCHLLREQDL